MLFRHTHTLGLILARIKTGTLRMGEGIPVVRRSERQKSRGASEVDSRVFLGLDATSSPQQRDRSTKCDGHFAAASHHQGCQLPTQHLVMDHLSGSNAGRD